VLWIGGKSYSYNTNIVNRHQFLFAIAATSFLDTIKSNIVGGDFAMHCSVILFVRLLIVITTTEIEQLADLDVYASDLCRGTTVVVDVSTTINSFYAHAAIGPWSLVILASLTINNTLAVTTYRNLRGQMC
jgi:hypothetical protein